jgi:hypothetical protein
MTNKNEIPIFDVWDKYENIAMHFNDLLIKLRTQSLGGVAAITSIVAIISKDSSGFNWAIMSGVFFFLITFWVAIWILDFKYYNRLLVGAVEALLEIEKLTKDNSSVSELNLSHKIEDAVAGKLIKSSELQKNLSFGRKWYYGIVFSSLMIGLILSLYKYICT